MYSVFWYCICSCLNHFYSKQEREIINLVLANNAISLREIQAHIVNDHLIFNNVQQVSLSTVARILKKHQVLMKRLYKVPLEINSDGESPAA